LKKADDLITRMIDDFKVIEYPAQESLGEFWKNEHEGMREQYQTKSRQKPK
jgi:hypothetical protein